MNEYPPVALQLGSYHLIQLLAESSFSQVYLGVDKHADEQVAIKLLTGSLAGEEAEQFLTRTAALAQLRHPHLVPILDFGIAETTPFLVMEYAPHGSLRQKHPKGTQIPLEVILQYVSQIAQAVQYLHSQGLVHRDIKPHNLLLGAQGQILLNDFGTTISSFSLHPDHLSMKDFEGTVLYTAPEQLQGQACRASDQYALGMVIYEWLCGELPFSGSFHEIAHQHLFVTPPPFATKGITCAPNIEQVIMRALAKDPQQRFPHIGLFADELEWACKVAQARGHLPLTTTSAQVQAINPRTTSPRQFKSPLPFTRHTK